MSLVFRQQRFCVKRDTAAAFTAANTLLLEGEFALETDTRKLKIGDGSTAWNDLDYVDAAVIPYDNTGSTLAAVNVHQAIDELDLKKVGDAPSDGNTYGRKDGAWALGGGGSGGAMTLLGSATVAGAAASALTLSGLDLDAAGSYRLQIVLKNATASTSLVAMNFNSDTTDTNYWRESLDIGGSTVGATRSNNPYIAVLEASTEVVGEFTVMQTVDGYPYLFGRSNRRALSSISIYDIMLGWNNIANVTSLTVLGSVASSLAVGSYFKVFRIG